MIALEGDPRRIISRNDPKLPLGGAGDGTIIIISHDKVKCRGYSHGISLVERGLDVSFTTESRIASGCESITER
jgi:hypothetical protein